ncbi:MAG: metalloprotease TldD [Rhodospirillaceae bacterium]|nr:metalloprotease TldD [Rhodospirillaceae bacterium]MYH37931.1 metalloprotease TldD [Rhodospirillaceae bacterium]MYK15457.1 metalloprotease TldD [Rhodospirillaceae bacterium]
MSDIATADSLFFDRTGMDRARVDRLVGDALHGADDGELFLEYTQSESLVFDDGRLKSATFDECQGFGLRALAGEATGYAHASELSEDAIERASTTVRAVLAGHSGAQADGPQGTNRALYAPVNPLREMPFERKVKLLEEIDEYARSKDGRIRQVSASLLGEWQAVLIVRGDGRRASDIRPLVRLNVSVVAEQDGRMEAGYDGAGGRAAYDGWFEPANWRGQVDEALRQALVNLESVPAPAGEMPVVLGPGWTGVLLHEAVGHGLEGDFNRKRTSTFSGRIGEQVAASGVTVVDDGTMAGRRGSLTIDDEGTPTGRTVLIEDGILKGYMQDRLNARLMGVAPTGNGRREGYAHHPMPRMTNTFMLAGGEAPEDILKSVDRGLYCVHFGGGQVDITSGKFTFSCTEAYKIEGGKVGAPVKGATLIGNGPEVMNRVSMIGHDLELDHGIGTCGKNGQGVPVGVGQPTVRVDAITVGGTEAV